MRTFKEAKAKQRQARANARQAIDRYPTRVQPQSILELAALAVQCASRSW